MVDRIQPYWNIPLPDYTSSFLLPFLPPSHPFILSPSLPATIPPFHPFSLLSSPSLPFILSLSLPAFLPPFFHHLSHPYFLPPFFHHLSHPYFLLATKIALLETGTCLPTDYTHWMASVFWDWWMWTTKRPLLVEQWRLDRGIKLHQQAPQFQWQDCVLAKFLRWNAVYGFMLQLSEICNHHTRPIAGVFHKAKILHNHDHCNAEKILRVKFLLLSRLSTRSFSRSSIQPQKLHSLSE